MSERHETPEAKEQLLRKELSELSALIPSSDAKVSEAQDALTKCEQLRHTARTELAHLKAIAEETAAKITAAESARIVAAIKGNAELLSIPVSEPPDHRELDRAISRLATIEAAFSALAAELQELKNGASQAKSKASVIIDDLMDLEAEKLGMEIAAAYQAVQEKTDLFCAMLLIDERRPGGQRLRQLNERVSAALESDPYKLAIQAGYDVSNWKFHAGNKAIALEPRWTDLAEQLQNDPGAKLKRD